MFGDDGGLNLLAESESASCWHTDRGAGVDWGDAALFITGCIKNNELELGTGEDCPEI